MGEFASVVDAVACAIAIQLGMAERDKDVAEPERIRLRIGVNLGDVVVEGDDLQGDGVNVAARLEGLAEPALVLTPPATATELDDGLLTASEAAQLELDAELARISHGKQVHWGAESAKVVVLQHLEPLREECPNVDRL